MEQAPPKDCPQSVFDAILDTPEPDKWIDFGEARPLPMFHMHTMMKYGEKCAFTAVTHGMAWAAWQAATAAERERIAAFVEGPCGDMQLADRNELREIAAAIRSSELHLN